MPPDAADSPADPVLAQLRALTEALPGAVEIETWGHPTFRVRKKMFASYGHHDERACVTVKATRDDQAVLVPDESTFFVPRYVGQHGWVGIWAQAAPWPVIADLFVRAYRMVALKKMVAELDARLAV